LRTTAVYGTTMVILAMSVNLLHGISHVGQEVLSLQAWQWAYVGCVIFLAPVIAAVLLWSPYPLAGAWLLFGSMVGSFIFDLAYHFLIEGPDNVLTLEPGAWLVPFRISALLLVATSGLGALVGGWAVLRLSRLQTPSEDHMLIEKAQR
jgi:hypothetical protein